MCHKHYNRWLRYTDVDTSQPSMRNDILRALPGTRQEIEQRVGCSASTAHKWLQALRDVIYISGWKRPDTRGPFKAVYAAGQKPDVPCTLVPESRKVCEKRWREKNREACSKKEKARYARKKALKSKANWASALGVPP